MNDAEAIRIIREAMPDVIAIYPFGSTASGQTHGESDIDLAFLVPQALPSHMNQLIGRETRKFREEIIRQLRPLFPVAAPGALLLLKGALGF